ncbi:hypothetical protein JRQ81_012201 [Phrynocephalus forsythii]|uniref:Myb/SANT-like DNA-binding domain-containing protein n=1 Tax=Phrynocephalus forsythii TaxID=171643 RepID=A0A9Q0X5J3_9SAUR|nr:hypothetical protein JRQ81_012201 [Phrynocephalus forsythii]
MGPVLFHLQPRRNEHAFWLASHQLARLNYTRTPTQIRSKFKTLRQNFNRCLFYFGEGAEERNQSAYWGQLLSLWVQADRPHPANLFPAGAGPARRLGQRREALGRQGGHGRRVHLQEDAEVPERLPDQFVEQDDDDQGLQGNIRQEEPNAPDVGAPPEPEHAARGEQQGL